MNPLGAVIIAASSGAGLYIILREGMQSTQKGSIIAAVIFTAMMFGCLIVEDDSPEL
jgi:hypothetical protein